MAAGASMGCPLTSVQILDGAVLADDSLQYHRTLNTGLAWPAEDSRLDLVHQQALGDALRHANALRSRRLGNRGGSAADNAAQNAAHGAAGHAAGYAAHDAGHAGTAVAVRLP